MASDFHHLRPLHPGAAANPVTGDHAGHGLIHHINGSQATPQLLFGPTPFNLVNKDGMDPAASVAMALGPPQLQLGCGNGVDESVGDHDKGMKRGIVYSGINYNDGNSYGEDSMEYNMLGGDQHDEVGSYGMLSLGDQGDQHQQKLMGACSLMKGARRLGYEQVKALERAFESDNRLEPERKVRLASQLGLQPRQVAVWFQNRRARWKTKQLEKDYSILKSNFEALKADRDKLLQEKHHLQAQLARLKGDVVESKQTTTQVEQDSTTLVSCSNAPNNKSPEENDPGLEVDTSLGEKQENDSLSSTEDSESNGAIEEPSSITILQTQNPSKPIITDPDYYNHLRFSSHQLQYKGGVKNEESWETIEEHGSLNFPGPDWYWS